MPIKILPVPLVSCFRSTTYNSEQAWRALALDGYYSILCRVSIDQGLDIIVARAPSPELRGGGRASPSTTCKCPNLLRRRSLTGQTETATCSLPGPPWQSRGTIPAGTAVRIYSYRRLECSCVLRAGQGAQSAGATRPRWTVPAGESCVVRSARGTAGYNIHNGSRRPGWPAMLHDPRSLQDRGRLYREHEEGRQDRCETSPNRLGGRIPPPPSSALTVHAATCMCRIQGRADLGCGSDPSRYN